jgi:hypothetical protein
MDEPSLNHWCRSQYSNEPYDYPPNIKETFSDLGRTVSEKVHLLSTASSPAEAQAALVAPPSAKPQPKTFSHAIARAALSSSQVLHQQHTGAGEDPLATALEKYALSMERVGEARLQQDAQIQTRFLAGWNTTLNTNIMFATRARKDVENSRLTLDSTKARVKGTTWKLHAPGSPRTEQMEQHPLELSRDAQEEVEKAEDEFVTHTEEAVGVMKNVGATLHCSVGRWTRALTNYHVHRFSIPPNPFETWPSLLPPRLSTTSVPMRF